MVRTQAKRNLRAAANILERRGLAKGTFGGETTDDPICVLRALQFAKTTPDIWDVGEEAVALRDFLELDVSPKVYRKSIGSRDRESRAMGAIITWSEKPERTVQQVCNALLRAAT